ncbi:hypothetical protein SH139x_005014 [Planctomycetaceae bacterium SH139]
MQIKHFVYSALFVIVANGSLVAQTTDTQKFRVVVPANISISPPAEVEITHDESESDQPFPQQQWLVKGNVLSGLSVSFATVTPFTHTTAPDFKRDARLNLAVAASLGPANWTVDQATDQTDYQASNLDAVVLASSDGVGRATFDLGVEFITDGFGSFAAGNYETTIVGTVTAN